MNEIELIRGFRSEFPRRNAEEVLRQRAELVAAIRQEPRGRRWGRLRWPRRRVIAIAVASLLVPAAAVGAATEVGPFAPPEKSQPVPDSGSTGPPEPTLGSSREARALEVMANDERAQRFLDGREYEVARSGPWTIDTPEEFEVFGAFFELKLAEPASYPMQEWPDVVPAEGNNRPYRERTLPMAAENVRRLSVLVDLNRERVVEVEPLNESAEITPGPEFPFNPPTGE